MFNFSKPTIQYSLLFFVCLLSGCVSPVLIDYDREAVEQFSAYQCFAIDSPTEQEQPEDSAFSPIVDRRFSRELDAALKSGGYTADCAEPDFRVRFYTIKETITQMNFNYPVNYRYAGNVCLAPNVGYFPPPYVDRYDEGTFLIDIIDSGTEMLVWRGSYAERLRDDSLQENNLRTIIERILEQFPPETE